MALLAGCAGEGLEKASEITVSAQFLSDQDTQAVWVDSVYAVDTAVSGTTGVSGATVKAWVEGGDTVVFAESQSRPGLYLGAMPVLPETTYHLWVQAPLADTWQEHELLSRSPKPFELLEPSEGETLSIDSVILRWHDPGNHVYFLRIFAIESLEDTVLPWEFWLYVWPCGDTCSWPVPRWAFDQPGFTYELALMAADTTYSPPDQLRQFYALWCQRVKIFVK